MIVTALGTGTGLPDPLRGPAGFLVETQTGSFLMDGGSGTLQKLAQIGCDPVALTAGLYSHWHPDHCADLIPLLFAMHGFPGRTHDYPIYAGKGFGAFFAALGNAYGRWIKPRHGSVQITELSDSTFQSIQFSGIELTTAPAAHMKGSLHLKIRDLSSQAVVVFSGDTGPSHDLALLAADADLLICECAGSDTHPIQGHMTPKSLRALIDTAQPKEVWVTHLYPSVSEEELDARLENANVSWCRPTDLQKWRYSHSIVAGGLEDMS